MHLNRAPRVFVYFEPRAWKTLSVGQNIRIANQATASNHYVNLNGVDTVYLFPLKKTKINPSSGNVDRYPSPYRPILRPV
jgi:hypothetical protein